jgi:hypothetical protein
MKRHSADLFIVLALFCVYVTSALLLSAIGAGVYRDTTQVMEENYDLRTGVLYVAEKTRQNDNNGAVRVASFNGSDALVFSGQGAFEGYETWIFVHLAPPDPNNPGDHYYLYEELVSASDGPRLSVGQKVMPMQSMELELRNNLLTVSFVTEDGEHSSIQLALKSQPVRGSNG